MARPSLSVRVDLGANGPDAAARLAGLCELASRLERSPAEGIWLAPAAGDDALEPLVALGALAAVTDRLVLAEAPSSPARRPPSLTAKYVSSLDVVANGRALCVLGHAPGELDVLAEALEVVRALLRTSSPSLSGEHFLLDHAHNEPRSAARPVRLGLLVDDAALASGEIEALCELAARFADALIVGLASARVPKLAPDARRAWLHRAGRLLDELELSVLVRAGTVAPSVLLAECERLQIDGLVLDAGTDPDPDALIGELELLADR